MNNKFFSNDIKTLEELRKEYKKLIFKYHPDLGGKTEDMQELNAEYERLYKIVGNVFKDKNGNTYTKNDKNTDIPDEFKDIINKIFNFNIDIEICGCWLWVFRAYQYKEQLKELGFFYCSSKKAWAWTDRPTNNKHRLTMEEIRNLHGSEKIKEQENKEQEKLEEVA